jgi:hypothetical protein
MSDRTESRGSEPSDAAVGQTDPRARPVPRREVTAAVLPVWLTTELRRAGVSNETVLGLDEDQARELVTEIRSDRLE